MAFAMLRMAVVGLGKMGLSHYAILNAHPELAVVAVCDSSSLALSLLHKYTGVNTYSDFDQMLSRVDLDAILIATPSASHEKMVAEAIARGIHVFCEKPFTLVPETSFQLARLAQMHRVVGQVGYHNRFVAAFQEVKRLLDNRAIGQITHVLAEAYGPVVLKPTGSTWRSRRELGGGCLHDYAAHAIDLLNWYVGEPQAVAGAVVASVFSKNTDDQVFGTLTYPSGATAQVRVDWSDDSQRKMTTRISLWGTAGRIYVDRQECQVYIREDAPVPSGYEPGWNVRYTTDLTPSVDFYLRGEEYTAQLDHFVKRVQARQTEGLNDFASAALTDSVLEQLQVEAARWARQPSETISAAAPLAVPVTSFASWAAQGRAMVRARTAEAASRAAVDLRRRRRRMTDRSS